MRRDEGQAALLAVFCGIANYCGGGSCIPHCELEMLHSEAAPTTSATCPITASTIIPGGVSLPAGTLRTVRQAATGGTSVLLQYSPSVVSKPGHADKHST